MEWHIFYVSLNGRIAGTYKLINTKTHKLKRILLNLPPMVKENEEEQRLAQELATGSRKAFQEIFMRYYPKVRYFVLGLVKSDEDAEDLAQDIFAKLWTNRAAIAEVRNLGV